VSLFQKRLWGIGQAGELIPPRPPASKTGTAPVTNETALRSSAVWACLRLRANLISTFPLDVFRRVNGIQVEVYKPPVLVNPGGERVDLLEWMYSSQVDLDRAGNTVGVITERDARALPSRIDLAPISEVTVRVRKGEIVKFKIGREEYDPSEIWHEKQYTIAGLHVGLSPVAYAAWTIGEYLSIQDFALDWFGNGTIPAAILKNTKKTLTSAQASEMKGRFKASVQHGDVFVTGEDWEYAMVQAEQAGADWIEAKRFGVADIARFFDCPGDMIDAAAAGSSVTYANITERNLQLLIHNIGPAVIRREAALSKLLPRPRYVKLNTDALQRMDPKARAAMFETQIRARVLAPSEARELDNRQPFTDAQFAEFERLFGKPKQEPTAAKTGVSA